VLWSWFPGVEKKKILYDIAIQKDMVKDNAFYLAPGADQARTIR